MPYKRGRKGKQGGPGRTTPVSAAAKEAPTTADPAPAESSAAAADDEDNATDTNGIPPPALPTTPPDDLILTSEKRRGVYECDYCHADISQVPRIRCAVCPDFDLCLECFTTTDHAAASARLRAALATQKALQDEGTVVTQTTTATAAALHHDHTHGYRVCDSTRYPLFPTAKHLGTTKGNNNNTTTSTVTASSNQSVGTSNASDYGGGSETRDMETSSDIMDMDEQPAAKPLNMEDLASTVVVDDPKTVWTAEEDLRLLEGISSHGLGNWVEIADVVSGAGSVGKTPRRCMERYMDDFLGKYGHILPPYTMVMENVETTTTTTTTTTTSEGGGCGDGNVDSSTADNTTADEKPEASSVMDGTPRASKRRAVLLRTPSSASATAAGWTQRKRFKCVPTESLPGFEKMWPRPYLPPGVTAGQEVGRDVAAKAEQTYVRLTTAAANKAEAKKIHAEWKESRLLKPGGPTVLPPRLDDICSMAGSELVGFMPRRGDFDIEWENDAEQAVADMEFIPDEPPEDRKLKLQVLAIYNSKLDEREKRKNFIISRQLWDYKQAYAVEAKLPRDERDLVHRMRLVERFHTPAEHNKFLGDILKAKRLRKEIAKLQMYRRMGMRTLADAERYELDKQRRLTHRQVAMQQKDGDAKKEDGTASGDSKTAGLTEETTSTSLWKQYRTGERRNRKSINRGTPFATSTTATTPDKADGADDTSNMNTKQQQDEATKEPASSEADTTAPITKSVPPSTLSSTEQELCKKLDLTEEQYKEIKKALIFQSLSRGLLDKESIGSQKRSVVKLDAERKGQVIEFMLRAGWVSAKSAATLRQQSSNVGK